MKIHIEDKKELILVYLRSLVVLIALGLCFENGTVNAKKQFDDTILDDGTKYCSHTFKTIEAKKESTCTKNGTGQKKCTKCGYIETYKMALKAHTLGSWQKDDTNHWRVCTVCKGEFEKAKHEYKNGECICGKQQNQIPQTKADLLRIGDSTTIEVGDKTTLWAMVGTVRVGNSAITWRSADNTIATVSSAGTVTGAKAGSVAIIGIYEGKIAYCNITVKAKTTTVDSISLNYSNLTIDSGNSATLKATIKPTGYTGGVTWKLINVNPNRPGDDFISMSNGSISTRAGSSGGTARVTATAGTLTAYCDVTVKNKTVTATKTVKSITLNKSSVTLGYGNTKQITATVKYSDGSTDSNVTWKSKDTSIASVNNGTITAKGTGDQVYTNKTNITVTSNFDSKVTKTITVTVKKCSAIYTVSGHETYIDSVYEKDTDQYHKVNKVCSRCGTEWFPKKEVHNKKAIPNNDGTHYEWCGCGYSGTVKHTWKNGKCSVCEINKEEEIKVTGMRFEETNMRVNAGESIRIQPILEPSGAKKQSIVWSTSGSASGFATVKNGLVTTNKDAGGNTVYIDAYLEDNPSIKARCTLNIVTPVKMVKISGEKEVEVGKTIQLKAEVTPDNASDKKVVWESNKAGVATVNANGVVTGVTAGKGATIKATAGGRSSTYYIKVVDKKVAVTGISVVDATVTAGSNVTLKATITPSNADNKKVNWSIVSSEIETGIVKLDKEKGRITVSKEATGGKVIVQATTEDGGYTATCTVTLKPKVNKIIITSDSKKVEVGGILKLEVKIDPETIKANDIVWSSRNESVAAVDQSGNVYGKTGGKQVTIDASSNSLGKKASYTIKVEEKEPKSYNMIKEDGYKVLVNKVSGADSLLVGFAGAYQLDDDKGDVKNLKYLLLNQTNMKDVNSIYMEVYGGRSGDDKDKKAIEKITDNAVEQIKAQGSVKKVVLYGLSRGGFYLDTMYQKLRKEGIEVAGIIVADACPPEGLGTIVEDEIPMYLMTSNSLNDKNSSSHNIAQRTKNLSEYGNAVDYMYYKDDAHGQLGKESDVVVEVMNSISTTK